MVSIIFPFPYHVLDDCEDQPLLSVFKKAEVEIRPEPDQEQWRLKVVAATSGIRFLPELLDTPRARPGTVAPQGSSGH